jgi:signal transduction histidine kinase
VDVTEITRANWGPVERLRRRLGRSGPASLRAQVALTVSAFLLGGVLSALLFVGVWSHTAAEGDRARARQAESARLLQTTRAQLARSEDGLATARTAVRKLSIERSVTARELARLRSANARAVRSLPPPLRAIGGDAESLGRDSAKLGSALATLSDYLRNSSGTGIDPAFLAAQIQYLIGSAAATKAAVSHLAAEVDRAEAATAMLRRAR